MNLLLRAGAKVNGRDDLGYTALCVAAIKGHSSCLDLLLNAGADVNMKTNIGATALFAAVEGGHSNCTEKLIASGADVNVISSIGDTVFHLVSYSGSFECSRTLLKENIIINKTNNKGQNVLQMYMERNEPINEEFVMYLYAAGEVLEGMQEDQLPSILRDQKLNLKQMSREAIRKQFITLNPHEHLFGRIPSLVSHLPPALIDYLLFRYTLQSTPKQTKYKNTESALPEDESDNDKDDVNDDFEIFHEYNVDNGDRERALTEDESDIDNEVYEFFDEYSVKDIATVSSISDYEFSEKESITDTDDE